MRRFLYTCFGLVLCVGAFSTSPARGQTAPSADLSFLRPPEFPREPEVPALLPPQQTTASPVQSPKISPNTGMPIPEQVAAPPQVLVKLALESTEYLDPRFSHDSHSDEPIMREKLAEIYQDQIIRLMCSDLKNFYWSENTVMLGMAVAVAAPIANTHADLGVQTWYQRQAGHSNGANQVALFVQHIGQWQYAVPVDLALSLVGHLFPDNPFAATVANFGDRSLRAMAVGAPMVGLLQVGLGPDQPGTNDSHWHPFSSSYGASSHAFVGAIPFLTAAEMTDSRALQVVLVAASLAPAWSRIQTNEHYLSQVMLGWTCAYLAVRSVNQTEEEAHRRMQVVPMAFPNGAGVGVMLRY